MAEDMRSTRNASKSTPPPPKKPAKGTKSPAAEKKENVTKSEATDASAENAPASEVGGKPDAVTTAPVGTHASSATEGVAMVQPSKEEKADDAMEVEAANDDKTRDLVVEIPQEAEASESNPQAEEESTTPERTANELPVNVISNVPADSKLEDVQVPDMAMKEAKEVVSDQAEAVEGGADMKASDLAEEQGDERKSLEGKAEQEMKGTGEDRAEDQKMDIGNDGAEDEAEGDEEGDEEEDEEGEDDVVEPKLVTERQKRKELEVFVGGLHKDATEEEVKEVFETVGEVVEIRLMKHPQSGKNKGYAFVQFASAEQATRAATELDKTKIRDQECAVAPIKDNNTLFVGNICKSWKLEQVQEKLKGYGVEAIAEITLVEDPENEGNHKGHAFLEFETHNDASKAFKLLSKPEAIFGCDRSARVSWAEGITEADKVKSVFVNGMPTEWDDSKIKEHFGKFGSIDRIVLAKNIPRSKRADYAFVNFSTRDAALAAIEALNDIELEDGDTKITLKVQLAKPALRKKRSKGYRGAYLVNGPPPKKNRSKGGERESRRAVSRGGDGNSQKNFKGGLKRKVAEDKSLPKERSQYKRQRGARVGAAVHQRGRGGRVGTSSLRQGRPSDQSDEEYLPMGARMSPVYATSRGFSGRARPREVAYRSESAERGYGYSSRRAERLLDEEAVYYGAGEQGYPMARMDYAEPTLGVGSLYPESLRGAPLVRGFVGGHVLPAIRGRRGYAPVLSRGADLPAATDARIASYPSAYYGSRAAGLGPYY